MVEHTVRDREAVSSSLTTPTFKKLILLTLLNYANSKNNYRYKSPQ